MASVYALIDVPETFRPKAGFALKTMLSAFFMLGDIRVKEFDALSSDELKAARLVIFYGPVTRFESVRADVYIAFDEQGFLFYDQRIPFLPANVIQTEDKLPVLFGRSKAADLPSGRIYADLISSAFYFLSDWDSLVVEQKDEHGRLRYNDSLLGKLDLADRPVVNEYCELIREVSQVRKGITLPHKKIGEHEFAACITHDFDRIKKKYAGTVKRELFDLPVKNPLDQPLGERIVRAFDSAKDLVKNGDGYERSILGMFEIERKLGIKPTVLFKSILQKHERDAADYLEYPFMNEILRIIEELKGDCGLHASYLAGYSKELFAAEKNRLENRLGNKVGAHRFHYLRYDAAKVAGLLEANGIRSDSSIGWAERAGLRSGFTFPYYLFDAERNTTCKVLEIPMQMMEMQLLYNQGLSAEKAVQFANRQADTVKKYGGVLCWNFHHHALDTVEAKGGSVLFEQSLSYLQSLNPMFLTLGNVHETI